MELKIKYRLPVFPTHRQVRQQSINEKVTISYGTIFILVLQGIKRIDVTTFLFITTTRISGPY